MVSRLTRNKLCLVALITFLLGFLYLYLSNAPTARLADPPTNMHDHLPPPVKRPPPEPAQEAPATKEPEKKEEEPVKEPAKETMPPAMMNKEPPEVMEPPMMPEAPKLVDPDAVWIPNFIAEAKSFDSSRHCIAGEWNDGNFVPSEACAKSLHPPQEGPILSKNPIWIVIVGDSNFRRVFTDLCSAFGLVTNFGTNQYSDRDCSGNNVWVSLRFVPLWSHHEGTQGQKVDHAIFHPEEGVEHISLENGGYTWDFEKPWVIAPGVKPLIIWNFGLWELMSKGDDDAFHRRVVAVLKYRLKQISEADKWAENWAFITTPRVIPTDDRRMKLLTEERITSLNAIISKAILQTDHQVIDWYKISKQNPSFLADGYHLDGSLYDVAFQSILALVHQHLDYAEKNGADKS